MYSHSPLYSVTYYWTYRRRGERSASAREERKREKREKRRDLRLSIKPNDIKKKLMAKIKEHQKIMNKDNINIGIVYTIGVVLIWLIIKLLGSLKFNTTGK